MEGSSVGPYVITRKIGEGGMGTVWVGEHTLLGRRAAIKVLLPEYTGRDEVVQRFFNEARAVTAIADPGIVQVFDFGYNAGTAFIVMELLEGEPMDARLRRIGHFPSLTAVRLMTQIATSLGAAHAKGVIHRDLKPENIFIVGDPAVTGGERTKILDFGIAKLAGDETSKVKTQTGVVMGTPIYMSPEQCRGAGSIDARSDIYTLGCVLFTMLCGRPPFESDTSGDLIIMHVRDAAPDASAFEPSVIPQLDAVLRRCLQKSPSNRLQSTQELVQALAAVEAALLGAPAHAQPTVMAHDARTRLARPDRTGAPASGVPAPTTLSMANGHAQPLPRKTSALVAGLMVGMLAIGGGAFVLVANGDSSTTADEPATTSQPAPLAIDAEAVAMPAIDAGVAVDAPAVVVDAPHVDAGVAMKVTKKHHVPSSPTSSEKPTNQGGSNASNIDRGD